MSTHNVHIKNKISSGIMSNIFISAVMGKNSKD